MSVLNSIVLVFFVIGAIAYLIGDKWGLGEEFKKGFMLLGTMALSMIGMIVISPLIADFFSPVFEWVYKIFKIDPSIIPASLFANDMGGAPLSIAVAESEAMGKFNGLVVASMMGATISFTIPFAVQAVDKSHHSDMAFGLLCGIVTIPVGCFAAGLICKLPIVALLVDLLPLLLLAALISIGLIFAKELCVKIFKGLGFVIKVLIVAGLILGTVNSFAGEEWIQGLGTIQEGAQICVSASLVLAGMFPLILLLTKALNKLLEKISKKAGMTSLGVTGLIVTLASNAPTYGKMNEMDSKSITLNAALTVSGAFVLGSHLAFTMAIDASYVLPVVVGKLVAGVSSVVLAYFLYRRLDKKMDKQKIVIFGDSYSTFEGYNPENYAVYYPKHDVTEGAKTWWSLLCKETDSTIILNDSWSGSTVCNKGYDGDCSKTSSFIHRLEELIEKGFFADRDIDKVFVFGGTNDSWTGNTCGEFQFSNWTKEDLLLIYPGYAYFIHTLLSVVPKEKIHVVINTDLREEVSQGIIEICKHYGLIYTMLSNIEKENGHPNATGMEQIKRQILRTEDE